MPQETGYLNRFVVGLSYGHSALQLSVTKLAFIVNEIALRTSPTYHALSAPLFVGQIAAGLIALLLSNPISLLASLSNINYSSTAT